MNAEFNSIEEGIGLIYKPPEYSKPEALSATLKVKFGRDVILLKSFLDANKIDYKEKELEDTPSGRGLRIKRRKNDK